MALIGSLLVNLKARTASFDKKMKRSRKNMSRFGRAAHAARMAMSRFGIGLARLSAVAATAAVAIGAVGVAVGALVVKQAAAAEEIGSKFEAVFKAEAKAAQAFAKTLAQSVGRSEHELKGLLATLQDTFVPLGFAARDARKMSERLVELAVDLGSFNDQAEPDVIRDLQSAIVGNHETMRKYGVIISQATLSQELLIMGHRKGVLAATEQQKAQARLRLMIAGTTDAQGDALRTAGSFTNRMKALKASTHDVAVELGTALLPTLTVAAEEFGALAKAAGDFVKANRELIAAKFLELGKTMAKAFTYPLEAIERLGWAMAALEERAARFMVNFGRNVIRDLPKVRKAIAAALGPVSGTVFLAKTKDLRKQFERAMPFWKAALQEAKRDLEAKTMDLSPWEKLDNWFIKLNADGKALGDTLTASIDKRRAALQALKAAEIAEAARRKRLAADWIQVQESMAKRKGIWDFAQRAKEGLKGVVERFKDYRAELARAMDEGFLDKSEFTRLLKMRFKELATPIEQAFRGPGEFRVIKSALVDIRGLGGMGVADPQVQKMEEQILEQEETNRHLIEIRDGGGML